MDSSAQPDNHDPAPENDAAPTVLDLSSCQLRDLSSVDLPSSLVEVDLTANRLTSVDPRLSQLSNLKKLSLRQNLLNDDAVLPLSSWHSISALQVRFFISVNLISFLCWFDFPLFACRCTILPIVLVWLSRKIITLSSMDGVQM